ncbi:hypothetical protein AC579_1348 [Pseudocercospora musae]|uniref:Uncharacterized protein n=1 Tax=Pseudocercospora musae TaxID=113226 RepID=A0A139INY5_9PEZI|nr:hypothetical protein AC579_1348 [Pseudocercospora musae]
MTDKHNFEHAVRAKESNFPEDGVESSVQDAEIREISRVSAIFTSLLAGLALFSNGFHTHIIGYMKAILKDLCKDGMSSTISTKIISYLIWRVSSVHQEVRDFRYAPRIDRQNWASYWTCLRSVLPGARSRLVLADRSRDLENEDSKFRAYLTVHGLSTDFGESLEKEIKITGFKI